MKFGLVWFNGISTFMGYLMPNPVYAYMLDVICNNMSTKLDSFNYCYAASSLVISLHTVNWSNSSISNDPI